MLALAPAGTVNGRWVSIGVDGTGEGWWVDGFSSPAAGGSGDWWFKVIPSRKERSDLTDKLMHIAVNCSAGEYAILATVSHYKNGRSEDDEIAHAFQPAPPETVAEWIVRLTCAKK